MKVTNWCKKLSAAIVAAGIWVPNVAHAINIPLGDPSFEAYTVPAIGYAYANSYRPTSAWVDDLDNPPGYTQDNGVSAWLYNSTYAEDTTIHDEVAADRQPGDARLGRLFAQETSAVFEASRRTLLGLGAE